MKFSYLKRLAMTAVIAAAVSPAAGFAGDDLNKTVIDGRNHPVWTFNGDCVVHLRWPGSPMEECGGVADMLHKMVKVYFDFGSAKLTKTAKTSLDGLISGVGGSAHNAQIIGYADRVGNENANRELSKKRALAVANYLRDGGIINAHITKIRALGESQPATQCSGKGKGLIECLQEDRRVDVEVEYQMINR